MQTDAAAAPRSGVAPDYLHRPKYLTPGPLLVVPGARLKWYDLAEAGQEITDAERRLARDHVEAQVAAGALAFDDELGFAVLHRAGPGHLLSICTWRGNNELWLSVHGRSDAAFAPLPAGARYPTYCVWEMGAVWHESRAWNRYLYSGRDAPAREEYLADQASGRVGD